MLLMLCYYIASASLFLWTTNSVTYTSTIPWYQYLFGVVVLIVFLTCIWFCNYFNATRYEIMIMCFLMNIGLSVGFRSGKTAVEGTILNALNDSYFRDLLLMLVVFVSTFFIVRKANIYRRKVMLLYLCMLLPIIFLGTRLSGRMVYGSYLYFAGISALQMIPLILMGFPFVASYFVTKKEKYYLFSVKSIPLNLVSFLFYMFVLYIGCAICNEFGLLLILAISSSLLFFMRCKDLLSKAAYAVLCSVGAILATILVSHINDRVKIWLNPASVYGDPILGEKAESILFLLRHIKRTGFWGNGIGSIPESIIPTYNSDHVLMTISYEYSLLLTAGIVILGIILVRWMLCQVSGNCSYDRYVGMTCGMIIMVVILVNTASSAGSFIIAGLPYPWVSDGSGMNIMFTFLVAVQCALVEKARRDKL